MTIRRGDQWGSVGPVPPDTPVAHTDREAGRIAADRLTTALEPEGGPPTVVLLGGDLHRSLGAPTDVARRRAEGTNRLLPLDVLVVSWDGGREFAVAHVVARQRRWAGRFIVAMNSTHVGPLDLGPRAHPDDGLVDITDGRLTPRDRLRARRRALHGGHLPHPDLETSRTARWEGALEKATPLRVDGGLVGRTRRLSIEVLPDALVVAV